MNLLTGDLGNSRCKLRLWNTGEDAAAPPRARVPFVGRVAALVAARDFDARTGIGAEVSAWLGELARVDAVAVCGVASPALEDELLCALEAAHDVGAGDQRASRPEPGLAIACREPEKVGRDRLFAARGALGLCRASAIVVDAGTALTVDAVREDGTFLGGAIAPGPSLLATALAEGTARLPRIEPKPRPSALGRSTEEALQAGVVVGFRGAARELVDRVEEEAGFRGAPVVLTGGAGRFLREPSAFGARRVLEEPDLVHLGLLAAWDASRTAEEDPAPRRGRPR
jgi:pantothenate kinase type III